MYIRLKCKMHFCHHSCDVHCLCLDFRSIHDPLHPFHLPPASFNIPSVFLASLRKRLSSFLCLPSIWIKHGSRALVHLPLTSLTFSSISLTIDSFFFFFFFQGGFVISDIVFGCDDPTYNPSPVWELSLLT